MLLETLFSWDIDYEDMAAFILDTIDKHIMEHTKDVDENWDGSIDALRAAVVAQLLQDMDTRDTRMSRLEANALLKRYHQMYEEPLPSA